MAKGKKRTGLSKAEALTVQRRVDEMVRIRLDGAQFHDVREYVREKETEAGSPWHLAASVKPLSDQQLRRYVQRADRIIARHGRAKRSTLIYRHLARRENLYAKAVLAGDIRTALACLADAANLSDLYPAKRTKNEQTGKDGGPLQIIIEDMVSALQRAKRGEGATPAETNGHARGSGPLPG